MFKAVIFDLDGVIVSTDEYHFRAWKELAGFLNIPFSREDNTQLRGIGRMESLDLILKKSDYSYSGEDKLYLADKKNRIYRDLLSEITPDDILPGAIDFAEAATTNGQKIAIGSSSRNTPFILKKIGLSDYFDAVADGNDIQRSKPDPQVFLIAARRLDCAPEDCLVIEDANAGVEAAKAGGMFALAVGEAKSHPSADIHSESLATISFSEVVSALG